MDSLHQLPPVPPMITWSHYNGPPTGAQQVANREEGGVVIQVMLGPFVKQ
jgi:hypothetical protein